VVARPATPVPPKPEPVVEQSSDEVPAAESSFLRRMTAALQKAIGADGEDQGDRGGS